MLVKKGIIMRKIIKYEWKKATILSVYPSAKSLGRIDVKLKIEGDKDSCIQRCYIDSNADSLVRILYPRLNFYNLIDKIVEIYEQEVHDDEVLPYIWTEITCFRKVKE
jgi:hypothetical protein